MIDLKLIQNDFENSARLLGQKKVSKDDLQRLYNLIIERNKLIAQKDSLRAKLNNLSDDENEYQGKEFQTHWEIGERLGILDIESAVKISGSMFALFRKDGAKLVRSLIQLGLDINGDEYEEILPPHFVSSKTFTGTGHLPKFAEDAYSFKFEDLWQFQPVKCH